MRRSKYNASKLYKESGTFDSKREYQRYTELKHLQDIGWITDLKRQVPFELIPKQLLLENKTDKSGRTQRSEMAVKYVADFTYKKDGKLIVEDVKGFRTPDYVIKRKLMLYIHKIQIKEV